jgi:hypothetical protein
VNAATSLLADQLNSTPQQVVAFIGTPPATNDGGGDAPLPLWAWLATGCLLVLIGHRHRAAILQPARRDALA